jgi:hypothetical protein
MSALDPSGPSQPTTQQAYTTAGNPASKNPSESYQAASNSYETADSYPVDQRIPQKQASEDQAIASSAEQGIHGAPAGEEQYGRDEENVGRHRELDGEQMAAPGEGRVADAVAGRTKWGGVGGEQEDLAADLER